MDLRHLQTFNTIVEEGSFVRAAEQLQYAQSTISLQIQQLEEELGLELFDRQRRKIQLTPAGHLLLAHAQRILQQLTHLQQDLSDLAEGETGTIRVGMVEPVARLCLVEVLRLFRLRYPRVRLTIEILSTIRVHEHLAEDWIELGISTPPPANSNLVFEPLMNDGLVLLLPANHPLQKYSQILLSDLRDETLLLTHPPCAYRTAIEQAFITQGLTLKASVEVGSLEFIKQAVQQGLGIALLPRLAVYNTTTSAIVREIEDCQLPVVYGLISKEASLPHGKATQVFSDLLKQAILK
ncbi:MAG TPA: LysR family transcriptional regulator [Chloroflexia bacterium]|nr:LysR family transcriptional regulator [Chloroflexia bacterium]